MVCPSCGVDNIQGVFACEDCGMDLAGLDIPGAQSMRGLKRHIMRDRIQRIGPLEPLIAKSDTTIADAVEIMKKGRHGSVIVLDGETIVGIFTERDVLIRVWGSGIDIDKTPVREVMTREPVVLEEDDILAHAIHLMAVRSFRHIPIVKEGRPIGFVSVRGILRHISEQVLTVE